MSIFILEYILKNLFFIQASACFTQDTDFKTSQSFQELLEYQSAIKFVCFPRTLQHLQMEFYNFATIFGLTLLFSQFLSFDLFEEQLNELKLFQNNCKCLHINFKNKLEHEFRTIFTQFFIIIHTGAKQFHKGCRANFKIERGICFRALQQGYTPRALVQKLIHILQKIQLQHNLKIQFVFSFTHFSINLRKKQEKKMERFFVGIVWTNFL